MKYHAMSQPTRQCHRQWWIKRLAQFALAMLVSGNVFICNALWAKPLTITYPLADDLKTREFNQYQMSLLKLALDKSGVDYQLLPYRVMKIPESRSEYNLKKGRYDVHWLHTSKRRESELIPVRIPLYKGLTGWRIFLIAEGNQYLFSRIETLDQLRGLTAGQGHDWPDSQILRKNHFRLETSSQWSSLFEMLSIGRFDFFPRSVIEIWRDLEAFEHLNLEVEQTVALHYPTAYYFFVSQRQKALAEAIYAGLQIAVDDGSFDRIFNQYLGEYVRRANLDQRRVFHLNNPILEFPSDSKLWFQPLQSQARAAH